MQNPFGGVGATTKDLAQNRFALNSINQIKPLLVSAGVPDSVLPYALAQIAFETGGFKSRVSKSDYNLSGIKWINKPYQNAVRGSLSPEKDYYARFKSYRDWANDFKRILSIGGNAAPINATSLQDYVNRLHDNHYFTANPDLYFRGLSTITAAIPQLQETQNKEVETAKKEHYNQMAWWDNLEPWKKVAIGGGAGLFVLLVVTRR